MKKHSLRSLTTGRFIKSRVKACCGGSCGCKVPNIVSGRLYGYKGIVVRAFGLVNNQRLVCFHKTLTGLVYDKDLKHIGEGEVQKYLEQV